MAFTVNNHSFNLLCVVAFVLFVVGGVIAVVDDTPDLFDLLAILFAGLAAHELGHV
jgi:hypothetical protein